MQVSGVVLPVQKQQRISHPGNSPGSKRFRLGLRSDVNEPYGSGTFLKFKNYFVSALVES